MKGNVHLSFGLATGISTVIVLNNVITEPEKQLAFVTASAVGAILTDIDNNESMIGRDLRPFSTIIQKIFGHRYLIHSPFFILLFYYILNFIIQNTNQYNFEVAKIFTTIVFICSILSFISNLRDHQKIVKCIIIFMLTNMLGNLCAQNLQFALYGATFGMCGHLCLDILTKKGIPLLYPIKFKKKQTKEEIEKNKKPKYKYKHCSLLPLKSCVWYENIIVFVVFVLFFILLVVFAEKANEINCYNVFKVFWLIIKDYIALLK